MDDRYVLLPCRCGGVAAYSVVNEDPESSIYAFCESCGLMTPKKTAGLEYSAKEEVAKIWNAVETK